MPGAGRRTHPVPGPIPHPRGLRIHRRAARPSGGDVGGGAQPDDVAERRRTAALGRCRNASPRRRHRALSWSTRTGSSTSTRSRRRAHGSTPSSGDPPGFRGRCPSVGSLPTPTELAHRAPGTGEAVQRRVRARELQCVDAADRSRKADRPHVRLTRQSENHDGAARGRGPGGSGRNRDTRSTSTSAHVAAR